MIALFRLRFFKWYNCVQNGKKELKMILCNDLKIALKAEKVWVNFQKTKKWQNISE